MLSLCISLFVLSHAFGAQAGTASGDTISVRLLIDGSEISSASTVVGSGTLDLCAAAGSSCAPGSQHQIAWLDGDTFQVDWFDTGSPAAGQVVYELTGVDFVSG